MDEIKELFDSYIQSKVANSNLSEEEILKLKFEAKQELEIACETILGRAEKFAQGKINKFGVMI